MNKKNLWNKNLHMTKGSHTMLMAIITSTIVKPGTLTDLLDHSRIAKINAFHWINLR